MTAQDAARDPQVRVDEFAALLTCECPTWTEGTVVLTDAEANVVGYGRLDRTPEGTVLTVDPAPQGVRLLSSPLQRAGG